MRSHEVLIIGGGPGGSTLAALLAQHQIDVAIIEREVYPRFHIGESLLPATMPIFRESGFYDTLASGKYIPKYGATFVDYRSEDDYRFGFPDGFNATIPSAFEVERCEFDKDLLEHAQRCGATVYQPERVKNVVFSDQGALVHTQKSTYQAQYVVDASGREAVLGKKVTAYTANKDLNNVAVFAHYTDVTRYEGPREGDITIAMMAERAWAWIIPFKGERTSVGVVCHSDVFRGGSDPARYMYEMLSANPRARAMMQNAERITEVSVVANYSHTSETYAGERWLLLGDAAVFLDPIFSSGVHVSCVCAKLASDVIMQCLHSGETFSMDGLATRYQRDLDKGVKRFHALISLFYNDNFVGMMKKSLSLENVRRAFTSAVAGDVWNDENVVFQRGIL